jgi:type IV pilus assembly protein PilW
MAELLVAMTLGLVVLLAGARLLSAANQSYASQVGQAEVDDGGRYALETIGRAVRQAAFIDWERGGVAAANPAGPARLAGLDAASVGRNSDAISAPLPASVNGSDGSVLDCAGFPVHELEDGWSIFYVASNAQGEPELRCKYRGNANWNADAVVSGVDSFQVLYGLDTDAGPDGTANRYVNASALDALDAALVLAGASAAERELDRLRRTHWKRVVSVKVALLLHSTAAVHAERESVAYYLFGRPYADAAGDGDPGAVFDEAQQPAELRQRERRLFVATIALPAGPM